MTAEALEIVDIARVDDVTARCSRGHDNRVDERRVRGCGKRFSGHPGEAGSQGFDIDDGEDRLPQIGAAAPPFTDDVGGYCDRLTRGQCVFEHGPHAWPVFLVRLLVRRSR